MTEGDDIMAAINHKITPHLWYDKEAKEATELYTSVFPQSRITHITTIRDTPSGDCDVVSFGLVGQPFMAISVGPLFKFNPSISFVVNFDSLRDGHARESLDAVWSRLSAGGCAGRGGRHQRVVVPPIDLPFPFVLLSLTEF